MRPLDGYLVLDLSRVLAGPFCTMRLADLGARVIKVESAAGDTTRRFGPPFVEGESPYFMSFNRGKESVVLDLKSAEGMAFVHRVLHQADLLVENFRPGVMERLGLGDDVLQRDYPRLVRVGITGYGPLSPRRSEAAFDLAIQAESGLMAMNGPEGGEACRVPISIADLAAGSAASEAALAALLHRERTGEARRVDLSLLESLVALFGYQAQSTLMTGKDPRKMGHRHPNLAPYQGFATADGMLVLAVAMDEQWQRFVRLPEVPADLDRPEWTANRGRVENREALEAALGPVFAASTTEAWCERLTASDIPFGPVKTVGEMLDELKGDASTFLHEYAHETLGPTVMTTSAALWDGKERSVTDVPPPVLGSDTRRLVAEFAMDSEEEARWLVALCGGET